LQRGEAVLIDIREADEFARRRIGGAISRPLSAIGDVPLDRSVIFTCRTGMRTGANAARLAALVPAPAYVLEGGVDGWAAAGLPVVTDARAPMEMMRQVQIAAGVLILAGVLLGWLVAPGFYLLAGFVGAGLTFAGISGFCGMARVLALMPWNRAAA
jgi:rhodanese-related sulfurtransferase